MQCNSGSCHLRGCWESRAAWLHAVLQAEGQLNLVAGCSFTDQGAQWIGMLLCRPMWLGRKHVREFVIALQVFGVVLYVMMLQAFTLTQGRADNYACNNNCNRLCSIWNVASEPPGKLGLKLAQARMPWLVLSLSGGRSRGRC